MKHTESLFGRSGTGENAIVFVNTDYGTRKELLRITKAGKFFVMNREVQTDEEIRDLFAEWVRLILRDWPTDKEEIID